LPFYGKLGRIRPVSQAYYESEKLFFGGDLVLFSIYLVLAGLFSLIFVFDETGSLKDATSILYGIASILAGVSFILIKELPRNFGFITLAIFLLLDGINVERIAINNSDYPLYYFTLIGIIALVSGVFLAFKEGHGRISVSSCYLAIPSRQAQQV